MSKQNGTPPSVTDDSHAQREYPHSSGDRNTQMTKKPRKETFQGGTQRQPNIDAPNQEKKK
ncbi:hypothetical protein [Coralloluteibacterium stylophorae]|uniref:Uncharacterized protein n=1 Tax=Coralloluteibacterium stylophorae TaxID=1776034 RepID=A0A8J8AZH1_9GAMM|nr:hypothetical protein [Coralloluteibacterium stylophorae]MBS7455568.1 hypothetical protein [Coralloluteibacterium stylophorae]